MAPIRQPDLKEVEDVKQLSLQEQAEAIAQEHGISADVMKATIACESTWNPRAVGDGGTSFGPAQIHLPAHPHITSEQAMNPEFAMQFMASEFAAGRATKWTCYRKLYL